MDFYVYIHRRATTGEIFYVGKGRKGRAKEQGARRSKAWRSIVEKSGLRIEFVETGLSEQKAFDLEEALVHMIGRRDKHRGPLVNFTDGGEGTSGQIVVMTPERRANISAAKKGRPASEATKQKQSAVRKGKPLGRHHVNRIREGHLNSDLARDNLKTIQQNRKIAVVAEGFGIFDSNIEAVNYLEKTTGIRPSASNIVKCCKGKIRYAYGHVWRYATTEEADALKEKGATWAPLSLRSGN